MRMAKPVLIASWGKTDEPVTKVLALDKNEHNEHDNDAGHCERTEQRGDKAAQRLQRTAAWLMHFDRK